MNGADTVLLTVRDLHVAYGRVEAVTGVHLSVGAGQIVSVIGANGAGKSTLLGAVMGALPSRGVVEYAGRPLTHTPLEARVAAGMVLVPERRELFSSMTVVDNLRLGAYTRRRERAGGDLDAVYERFPRLRERHRQLAGTLSGGEQQMLAIGRALMGRPRLLLLDEPSLGLAPLIVREILGIVAGLRDSGVTVLLVEQNARAALAISDYGYVLEGGQVRLHGPAAELTDDPAVVASYLGGA
ncbi:ABC transporter ATP-binding protein [Deinococcus hopiensis]|uniref:Amino acid/amide ABC transporter ATP-binding protein 2, HAAT family n=1 Tax=Deinococcus hopiensis KR-140 TaxID=695939 RepID=A0A1W1UCK0_9DEIO|nr:ABC transporter ATP-binding protein [Deinococcus hopiensis]SMB78780.1 amino acid/amide ABC transporter ATP-binding protein 2, HAAT family [Deinococcus hopiensis KR-140]